MTTAGPEPPVGLDDAATELFDDMAATVVTVPSTPRPVHDRIEVVDDVVEIEIDDREPGDGEDERGADEARALVPVVGPVGIDHRLRERWIATRRAEGRRRLVVVVTIVSVLSVCAIAYAIAHSSLLGMDSIEVRGARGTAAATIRDAAAIPSGEPLLFLDTGAVARRVEQLPLVARASVDTELPGTVVIRVTERTPVAWVAIPGGHAVLDRDGRVLSTATTPPPGGLTEVVGLGPVGEPGTTVGDPALFRTIGHFPPALGLLAQRIEIVGADTVVALRGDGPGAATVRLGSPERLPAKLAAALAVYEDLHRRGERVHEINVTVPDAPFTR